MNLFQFEIWSVDLNPTQGSEQKGIRPCVILQTDAVGNFGLTTIIASITKQKLDKVYPYEIEIIPSTKNGLKEVSKIKCDQVRVISKERLLKKLGKIETKYVESLIGALNIIFDIHGDFR